jgi:hypothetical protein
VVRLQGCGPSLYKCRGHAENDYVTQLEDYAETAVMQKLER